MITRLLIRKKVYRNQIQPNTTIAPHLYDWWFNGTDALIRVYDPTMLPTGSSSRTIEVYSKPIIHDNRLFLWYGATTTNNGCGFRLLTRADFSTGVGIRWYWWGNDIDVETNDLSDSWHYFTARYIEGSKREIYLDNVLMKYDIPTPPDTNYSDIYIGSRNGYTEFFLGYISFTRLYNIALSETNRTESYNKHIISSQGLVLFLDATFFDGSSYVDLSGNGNNGTPYNVSRVSADHKWLWFIKDHNSDNLVHFRFFPVDSVISLYNSKRSYSLTVSSSDESLEVEPDNYTIEVRLPEWY